MRTHDFQRSSARERGFTLVEVMIASLLFAIGMIAVIAMQYSALGGYANSRDVSRATDVGERVIHLLKQESQQWQRVDDVTNMSKGVYAGGSSSPGYFASGSILNSLATSQKWTWIPVFTQPVDVRLSDSGARRYCAYIRGEMIENPTRTSPTRKSSGIYRVQVAVVYPGPNHTFPGKSQNAPVGSCDEEGQIDGQSIEDVLEPKPAKQTTSTDLEKAGYRAVFMGTQVILRNFLTKGGTYDGA